MEVELVNTDAANVQNENEIKDKIIEHIETKVPTESLFKSEGCSALQIPGDKLINGNINENARIDTSTPVFCEDNNISKEEEFPHVAKKPRMDENKENEMVTQQDINFDNNVSSYKETNNENSTFAFKVDIFQKEICEDTVNNSDKIISPSNVNLFFQETDENVDKIEVVDTKIKDIEKSPKEQVIINEDIQCKSPNSSFVFTSENDDTLNGHFKDENKINALLHEEEMAERDQCSDNENKNIENTCDIQDLQHPLLNISNDGKGEDEIKNGLKQDEHDCPENEAVVDNSQQNSDDNSDYEKSVPNDDIIERALQGSIASTWDKNLCHPCNLLIVDNNSNEFKTTSDFFALTSRGLTIEKLERVENPFLLAQYLLKKEQKIRDEGTVAEKKLFHGTQEKNIEGICKSNFDWRLRGSSRGHKFGQGVSFAPEVSYARHYTHGDCVMILADVLVCKSIVGHCNTVVPPDSYDTTKNSPETVFVKYEDSEFYPRYVIHY